MWFGLLLWILINIPCFIAWQWMISGLIGINAKQDPGAYFPWSLEQGGQSIVPSRIPPKATVGFVNKSSRYKIPYFLFRQLKSPADTIPSFDWISRFISDKHRHFSRCFPSPSAKASASRLAHVINKRDRQGISLPCQEKNPCVRSFSVLFQWILRAAKQNTNTEVAAFLHPGLCAAYSNRTSLSPGENACFS